MSESTSRTEAIQTAITENVTEEVVETPVDETVEEETTERTEEGQEETTNENIVEISQDEVDLLAKLKDPKLRKQILRDLASEEGLIEKAADKLGENPTKQAQRKTITELAQELMGDDYTLIPPSLITVLEKLVNLSSSELRNEVTALRTEKFQSEFDSVYSKLSKDIPDYTKFNDEYKTLSEEFPMPPGKDLEQHMRDLYSLAKARANGNSQGKNEKLVKRIVRNANAPTVTGKTTQPVQPPPQVLNRKDAIQLAIKQNSGKK
jgi:uncharacterized membrane-anchored protein YjiN (DUF445 family)